MNRRNGLLTKYNIIYYSSKWEDSGMIQVDSNITSVAIDGLIPLTTYSITIRAATIIRFGPSSDATLAKTLQTVKYI